jgi:hypothetical protein
MQVFCRFGEAIRRLGLTFFDSSDSWDLLVWAFHLLHLLQLLHNLLLFLDLFLLLWSLGKSFTLLGRRFKNPRRRIVGVGSRL